MTNNPYRTPEIVQEPSIGDEIVMRGRTICWAIIVISLSIPVIVATMTLIRFGPGRLPVQAVRFALTVALCVGLYSGRPWVRNLMGALCGLGALMSIPTIFSMLAQENLLGFFLMLIMGSCYGGIAATVLLSPSLAAFLRHQDLQRT